MTTRTGTGPAGGRFMSGAETAAAVRALVPLDQLMLDDGVRLTRSSERSLMGRCFARDHDDRAPSLVVYTDEQKFRCFGCGKHGDVINYVCYRDDLGPSSSRAAFQEALRILNVLDTNILRDVQPLPPAPPPEGPSEEEYAAIALAGEFYHQALPYAKDALAYLRSRGVHRDLAMALGLGFGRAGLHTALKRAGIDPAAALSIGLLSRRNGNAAGKLREPLGARVVVPEIAPTGAAVWLVGRSLPGSRVRHTYRNIRKRKPLLGHGRLPAGQGVVVVVEGPFDWLAAMAAGLPAVAVLGAPTIAAIEQLKAFRRVYLALDADDGGDEAAARIEEALGAAAVRVPLPEGANDVGDLGKLGMPGALMLRRIVAQAGRAAQAAA
ncbi:MAG: toprim domain-containing protein [Chloroflexi bacterium]|nr:toprim domain-containing protein [Chloroflexota bacterium]